MKAKTIREARVKADQAAPELAKQLRDRVRQKSADGDIHAVKHAVPARSRKHEVAKSKTIANKPPRRRWQRASTLPAMPPLPGYHLEYVRRDNRNRGDGANLSAHLRSGWEIAKLSDFDIEALPTVQIAGLGDVIGNDDTVLMKIDEETWAERSEYYDTERDAATRAVNSPIPHLDVSHQHMPIVDAVNKSSSNLRARVKRRSQDVSVAED